MLCPELARNLDAKNGGNSTFARFKSPDPVLPNEMPLGQAETGVKPLPSYAHLFFHCFIPSLGY